MIVMKKIIIFCALVAVFTGCHKEKELLTGDIMGKIVLYNQDNSFTSDNSGVKVSLYNSENTLLDTKVTDSKGIYRFEDIEYGKYSIDPVKDKFIKPAYESDFHHVGGFSPSIIDGSLYEIPRYDLYIDSLKVKASDAMLLVYLKIDGSVKFPFSWYSLVGYCGNDLNVSKDNYSFIVTGIAGFSFPSDSFSSNNANGAMFYIDRYFSPETIYIRFYLLSNGQSGYSPVNKEALGKPSNVMSFVWQ
jgi:hypothetical protein